LPAKSAHLAGMPAAPLHKAPMDETMEIRVVFDAPPGRDMPTLVTVEDEYGQRITGGQWRERADGYWELVFRTAPVLMHPGGRLN
jgi:hypothetical protein